MVRLSLARWMLHPEIPARPIPPFPPPAAMAAEPEDLKQEEEEEEELEDLPAAEKEVDPLHHVKIKRNVDGKEFIGVVEDIECGKITKERLYRVKYTDGDLEHLTENQVKGMIVQDDDPQAAGGEDEADKPMEEEVARRPAASKGAPKGKAKAKGKGKGKAKAKGKAKGKAEPKAKGKAKAKAALKRPAGR